MQGPGGGAVRVRPVPSLCCVVSLHMEVPLCGIRACQYRSLIEALAMDPDEHEHSPFRVTLASAARPRTMPAVPRIELAHLPGYMDDAVPPRAGDLRRGTSRCTGSSQWVRRQAKASGSTTSCPVRRDSDAGRAVRLGRIRRPQTRHQQRATCTPFRSRLRLPSRSRRGAVRAPCREGV